MAYPYDERSRDYRGERGHDRDGRNFFERAGEEVRSWFGGDDRGRYPDDYGDRARRDRMSSERGWSGPERGERSEGPSRAAAGERWHPAEEHWRGEPGRSDWDRWNPPRRGWDEPRDAAGPSASAGERWGRDEGTPERTKRSEDWRWRSASESRGIYEDDSGRVHRFSHWPETSYAGRGPKGYRRSDERIREAVCDRLTDDWRLDASEMEVTVQNGEVMLTGMVRQRDDKRRAEDLVEAIPGVRDVHNNLRVGSWDEGARTGTAAGGTAAHTVTPAAAPSGGRR
jgi:hypothetical protein